MYTALIFINLRVLCVQYLVITDHCAHFDAKMSSLALMVTELQIFLESEDWNVPKNGETGRTNF